MFLGPHFEKLLEAEELVPGEVPYVLEVKVPLLQGGFINDLVMAFSQRPTIHTSYPRLKFTNIC